MTLLPNYELVFNVGEQHMVVYPATADAFEWCRAHLPAYGSLRDTDEFRNHLEFMLYPNYDRGDFLEWVKAEFEGAHVIDSNTRQEWKRE